MVAEYAASPAELRMPALLVNAAGDPMVGAGAVRPVLAGGVPGLEVRWMAGAGHVGFPRGLDLGLEVGGQASEATVPRRVDDQVLDWLRRP